MNKIAEYPEIGLGAVVGSIAFSWVNTIQVLTVISLICGIALSLLMIFVTLRRTIKEWKVKAKVRNDEQILT